MKIPRKYEKKMCNNPICKSSVEYDRRDGEVNCVFCHTPLVKVRITIREVKE